MKWSERMIDEILAINEQPDITVLLAHINRYMRWNRPDLWPYLRREGVLMQINTEFLLDRWKCRTACRMLDDGTVAVVGTDCHNTTSRPPRMAEAIRVLEKRLGEGAGAWLSEQSDRVLRDHRLTGAEAIGSGES